MKSGRRPARNNAWRIIVWGSSLPALVAGGFLYFPYCPTGPVLCPTALLCGLPCPGCGLTRAFGHASHGRLAEAFAFHPLWPIFLGYLVFLWIYQMIEVVRGEPPKLPTYKIGGAALIGMMTFWAFRLAWFFAHGGLEIMRHDNA